MEYLNDYQNIIKVLLEESIAELSDDADFETQLICDRERDHYQLVSLGWQGHRRFYSVLIHLDIKDGKVWIQRNDTDRLIAQELMALGVRQILFWDCSLPMRGRIRDIVWRE